MLKNCAWSILGITNIPQNAKHLKEHSSVACNLSQMPSVYFEKWSSQKFPRSRNCILLKNHDVSCIFWQHFFANSIQTHYLKHGACTWGFVKLFFLLPFITLKLEVVAIFVDEPVETAAASTWYIIFSAPGSLGRSSDRKLDNQTTKNCDKRPQHRFLGKFITTSGHPKWRF